MVIAQMNGSGGVGESGYPNRKQTVNMSCKRDTSPTIPCASNGPINEKALMIDSLHKEILCSKNRLRARSAWATKLNHGSAQSWTGVKQ